MGKGKPLTDYEKGQIDAFQRQGTSNQEIARLLGRSPEVICNYVNDKVGFGTKKSTGRHPLLSKRDRRHVLREASNSVITSTQIKSNLSLNVSTRTIRWALIKSKFIKRRRLRKAPYITLPNKAKRIKFARDNQRTDWSKVSRLFLT